MTTFASLPLHPSLTRALDARGYQTATAVQAAVLDARCAGRDLLVSSQTGSGKTLAFGALLTQTLLGEAAVSARPRGARPLALTIVPTRELATQVREELGWLLKDTRLRLSSFTGGTGVVGDLRALSQGVDVVIGTPGRLVDLLRRERLDLTEVQVVVLDEADEMLDLGFREDLETLLQAAPVERRTIMLSATLPHEIRAMARKFQRDALPVDPRVGEGAGSAPSAAHQDIAYVAHTVAPGEKLATLINVLRAYDLESAEVARAIVFGTTREGVADLHAALLARGFAATAISGDRAQAERDRALEQIRRGEARILCATNVAARGIHLPEVDLIVHADLPLNAESLTHRSGRTGRAGRKGTAVLIVGAHERRKAERLLGAIKAQATWKPAPSVDAIAAAARARLVTELLAEPQDVAGAPSAAEVEAVVLQLESERSPREALAQLVARELGRLPKGDPLTVVRSSAAGGRDDRESPRRSQADFASGGVTFRVNLGARDKADPRWMLPLICRRGGVTRREVGAIRIGPRETTFEIAGDAARDFGVASALQDPRAPHVRIERTDGGGAAFEPAAPRPSRPTGHSARPGSHTARPAPHGARTASPAPRAPAPEPRPPELRAPAPEPRPPAPAALATSLPVRPPVPAERPAPQMATAASPGARPAPGPRPARPARPAPHIERRAPGPRPPSHTARPAPHSSARPAPHSSARPAPHTERRTPGPRPPGHTARPAPHGSRAHAPHPHAHARPRPKRK